MPAKSATLRDLQRRCNAEGLDATGTKTDLAGRLQNNWKNRVVLSPESHGDIECDAILVTQSELGDEEEMKKSARAALKQALSEEELAVEDVQGELFVGNRRGLNLAGLSTRVCALEDEVASLKREITLLKVHNTSLEDRVSSLTVSLDTYKILRTGFISSFKRDKLGNATDADRRIIDAGDSWAHGGDAVVDAQLYQSMEGRRDFSTFEKLYGMDPSIVLRINHKPTIDLLNFHAGIIASKHKTGTIAFYAAFWEFIKLFNESDYDESYLSDGGNTGVTRAYWSFLQCATDEVARVGASETGD